MILVNFQKTTSDNRKLNKDLTFVKDVNCKMINNVSMLNPTFLVQYDNELWLCNHAYIPLFNRHYFVNKIELIENNKMQITMSVDVLETAKDELMNLEVLVERNENDYNSNLQDGNIPTLLEKSIDVAEFNGGMLDLSVSEKYVLEVAGQ